MKKRYAYYARPISIDNTAQSDRDVELINSLGFKAHPTGNRKKDALVRYREIGMEAFRPYVEESRILVFRAFPDGSIGAGVALEIQWAIECSIPVLEIPRQIARRSLSVSDTRAMLSELGQR